MLNYWRSLSFNTKFSILAFPIAAGIGLLSMGLWGALLYFPARPLLTTFPAFEDWHGDWVWPALIGVGIFWSLGFIIAGISIHLIKRYTESSLVLALLYSFILWIWDIILWWIVLSDQF